MTTRRKFMTTVGAMGAAGLAAPAVAQSALNLRMVTTWPKGLPGLGTGADRFAARVTAATEGRVNITVYASGELVPALESFDAVQGGAADIMHSASSYWLNKSRALSLFNATPFGLNTVEFFAWMNHGGGQELFDQAYDPFGMKGWVIGDVGVNMGGWFRTPINSLDDLVGQRMRIQGLAREVYAKIGVSTITMPGGEVFGALQNGVIDAAEFVGPWNDSALGFGRVAPYYYYPGVHEPTGCVELVTRKDVLEQMSPGDRLIFEACIREEAHLFVTEYHIMNSRIIADLKAQGNISLQPYPDDVILALGNAAGEVVSELLEDDDEFVKVVMRSIVEARQQLSEWSRISTKALLDARELDINYPTI